MVGGSHLGPCILFFHFVNHNVPQSDRQSSSELEKMFAQMKGTPFSEGRHLVLVVLLSRFSEWSAVRILGRAFFFFNCWLNCI
jgi:hypothetical protein